MTVNLSTLKSINPATKEVLAETPVMQADQVEAAVKKAWQAFETWSLTDYPKRAHHVHVLRKVLSRNADAIAELITKEVGKPITESMMAELTGPLDACLWFADSTERQLKDQIVNLGNPLLASKQTVFAFEPLGVIGIISPWNYPFAIPMMSIVMAVMTGNTVVLKPSEKSPLVGIKIGELFTEAGFPEGVVSVVTGDRTTGKYLSESRITRVLFTGSVEGGSKVMAQAADKITPVSLELGGKDPAIVLPDAPAEWTARGITWGAFTNAGQACASIERLYLVRGKNTDSIIKNIVANTRKLKIGPGSDPQSDIGPLIDEEQLNKVAGHVDEAKEMGATILCGGQKREDLGGFFYEPTVLADVNHSMKIMTEETFGPVLPIMTVDSEDEAVELANESDYGLAASVWTKDLSRAEDVARDLEVGTVLINDCLFSFACPQVPWGGIKKSGIGRSHSYFGLLDLVNIKHISLDSPGGSDRSWWYPYGKPRLEVARGGVELLHGASLAAKMRGFFRFLSNNFRKPKK